MKDIEGTKIQKRTFVLGKVARRGKRKENLCTVTLIVKGTYPDVIISVTGDIWNRIHTDILCGGQCYEELDYYFIGTEPWESLYGIWERCHLSDLKAGTPAQSKALEDHFKSKAGSYEAHVEYLKSIGLYTVPASEADSFRSPDSKDFGKPYTYGHEWLTWPISSVDWATITKLLSSGNEKENA